MMVSEAYISQFKCVFIISSRLQSGISKSLHIGIICHHYHSNAFMSKPSHDKHLYSAAVRKVTLLYKTT